MPEGSPATDRDEAASPLAGPALRRATAEDIPRLRAMLADAFFDDPILGWLLPDERKRRARLRRFFGIELRHMALPRGQVWTTGEHSAAALIMPPKVWRAPLHATALEGRAFWPSLGRAARLGAAMEWHHGRQVREPHYYVRDVGVLPKMQGRGLGSALMRPTLDRCDQESLPAYLEASSERSAALYERLGFRLIRELRVGGSPPLRLMVRPPHSGEPMQ